MTNPPEPQDELDHILTSLTIPWDTSDLPPNVKLTAPSIKIADAKAAILKSYIPRQKVEEALPKHKCKEEVCQADHSITQAIDDLRTKLGLDK